MRMFLGALAAAAMLSTGVLAQVEIGRGVDPSAQAAAGITDAEQFVNLAAVSNLFEIESSQLALEMSQDTEIRAFAEQMMADHRGAGERLNTAVAEAGLTSQMPTEVDAPRADMLNRLRGSSDFDLEYTRQQIEAHDTAVALFTSYSENGDNEVLRRFATQVLPTLVEHRRMLPDQAPPN